MSSFLLHSKKCRGERGEFMALLALPAPSSSWVCGVEKRSLGPSPVAFVADSLPPPLFFATLLLHECANSGLSSARGEGGETVGDEGDRRGSKASLLHSTNPRGGGGGSRESQHHELSPTLLGGMEEEATHKQAKGGTDSNLSFPPLYNVSSTPESSLTYH